MPCLFHIDSVYTIMLYWLLADMIKLTWPRLVYYSDEIICRKFGNVVCRRMLAFKLQRYLSVIEKNEVGLVAYHCLFVIWAFFRNNQ